MHIRKEGVDRLDDRFVGDLRIGMAAVLEQVDLRHHAGHVDAGRLGIDRRVVALAVGPHLFADHPHVGAVDLAHRVGAVAAGRLITLRTSLPDATSS